MPLKEQMKAFTELVQNFEPQEPQDPASLFDSPKKGKWHDRFQMYASGYLVRTREALEGQYKHLPKLMDEEAWNAIGQSYIFESQRIPWNLNYIGDALPEFLREKEVATRWLELAELELLIDQSFRQDEVPVEITEEDLASIDDETIFEFRPTTKLYESDYDLDAFFTDENKTRCHHQKTWILVYRQDYTVFVKAVEEAEYRILFRLMSGRRLSEALKDIDLTAEQLTEYFGGWFGLNLFSALRR
jgi:hypothetical protein